MPDELARLQDAERRLRERFSQNGTATDDRERKVCAAYSISQEMPIEEARRRFPRADGLRPGVLVCDCICNCGSIVQVAFKPEKGTEGVLCMTCLELSRRKDPHHMPWPASGVVVLPPEK